MLVTMEDAQASFQDLRLSATSRLLHLLRTVPPSITCHAAANYDALVEWALASIIAGDGAAVVGLPTPEEVARDLTVCQNHTYLGHEALRQAHLPIRESGLGLTNSSSIKGAAYDGAAVVGLPTPEEVARDSTVCQNQTYLGHEALRQAHLPIREGDLGLTNSSSIKGAAYIGYHALVLERVVAASARGDLPSLLERLPE